MLTFQSQSQWCLVLRRLSYQFHPGYDASKVIDVSSSFRYTKLHVNYETTASPRLQGAQLPEYFVKITSILVNQKPVPINSTLLDFHKTGIGGCRITTVQPYTTLETSIYKSFVKVFDEQMLVTTGNRKVRKVAAVSPFKDCYRKEDLDIPSKSEEERNLNHMDSSSLPIGCDRPTAVSLGFYGLPIAFPKPYVSDFGDLLLRRSTTYGFP
ncbi:hypothetical protein GH714_003070 [Hevea brasiliensis]|uniref:Xylanase inhibitor C-terminal domain-containing protein n=1 Tax=Hevea brasiliensis TaxID=3981 RepID=A0A6A6KIY8_HEVBR|nr:hypothetical protein GH714_003070 [Hevea brasiliensis]